MKGVGADNGISPITRVIFMIRNHQPRVLPYSNNAAGRYQHRVDERNRREVDESGKGEMDDVGEGVRVDSRIGPGVYGTDAMLLTTLDSEIEENVNDGTGMAKGHGTSSTTSEVVGTEKMLSEAFSLEMQNDSRISADDTLGAQREMEEILFIHGPERAWYQETGTTTRE